MRVRLSMAHRSRAVAIAWAVAALTNSAEAADPSTDEEAAGLSLIELLQERVITASGLEEVVTRAPANILVFGKREIADNGWRSVADILNNVPGIFVVDDLVSPLVSVRGVNAGIQSGTRLIRVMINGVPVSFRPDMIAFIGPEYIPMEVVERVEVALGPLSALYGANAFLATVNVIVTRPTGGLRGTGTVSAAQGRSNRGYGLSGTAHFGSENLAVQVAASHGSLDRSGIRLDQTFPRQDPRAPFFAPFFSGPSQADTSQPLSLYGQACLITNRLGSFSVQGGLQRRDSAGEFQLGSVLTHKTRFALTNQWVSFSHKYVVGPTASTTAQIAYSQGAPLDRDARWLTAGPFFYVRQNYRYQALDGSFEGDVTLFERLSLKLGLDGSHEPHRTLYYSQVYTSQSSLPEGTQEDLLPEGRPPDITISRGGMYAQLGGALIPGWQELRFSASARLDVSSLFSMQPSWRAALIHEWRKGLVTKLILGGAYQEPSAVLLFAAPGPTSTSLVGNDGRGVLPALEPQTVRSAELVTAVQLGVHFSADSGLYLQELRRKIEFRANAVSEATVNYVAVNTVNELSAGLAGTARGAFGRGTAYLRFALDRPLEHLRHPDLFGQPLPLYPSFTASLGGQLRVPEVRSLLHGQLRLVGKRGSSADNTRLNLGEPYALPGYALLKVGISSEPLALLAKAGKTAFSLQVRDVLDARPMEPGFGGIDIPTPGRQFWLDVRHTF
jgi:iron complex outermembrane receptor protein